MKGEAIRSIFNFYFFTFYFAWQSKFLYTIVI
ncbi:hypothetical protein SAMN04488505_11110 [Chitinophaga rupis]|uniref:Uncharacterized protein n=1 Tax=Chitinophaga rupis TaxID=573321 RepID=A0A1H8H9X8_9BACT|nr:hypothetical protein SAMN04488505_11110 [Chitinophaga rupis]